jgi:hypothetical protein
LSFTLERKQKNKEGGRWGGEELGAAQNDWSFEVTCMMCVCLCVEELGAAQNDWSFEVTGMIYVCVAIIKIGNEYDRLELLDICSIS